MHCFHLEMKNREINSRVLFSETLTCQMWDDLVLREIKIICSVKQNLNPGRPTALARGRGHTGLGRLTC